MIENETVDYLNFIYPFILFLISGTIQIAKGIKYQKAKKEGQETKGLTVFFTFNFIFIIILLILIVQRLPLLMYIQQFN